VERLLDLDGAGIYLVVALAGIFLVWYFVGAYLTRRRLGVAARWVYRGLSLYRDPTPERTRASIKWLATNAFNIVLEEPRPPLRGVVVTVLLQSRDMMTVWLIDRLTGRRDLVLLRFDLERQPIWGAEIFRRRSLLAGDANRQAREAGWNAELTDDPKLAAAHGGGKAGDLCRELLAALGEERQRLVRLSVRRQSPHLTLALDLPDPATSDPLEVTRLGERLVTITLTYTTR
jgi:hypothetical protein